MSCSLGSFPDSTDRIGALQVSRNIKRVIFHVRLSGLLLFCIFGIVRVCKIGMWPGVTSGFER